MFVGDLLGYLLAWCSLAPIFLIVSFVTLIAFRRDLHTVSTEAASVSEFGDNQEFALSSVDILLRRPHTERGLQLHVETRYPTGTATSGLRAHSNDPHRVRHAEFSLAVYPLLRNLLLPLHFHSVSSPLELNVSLHHT